MQQKILHPNTSEFWRSSCPVLDPKPYSFHLCNWLNKNLGSKLPQILKKFRFKSELCNSGPFQTSRIQFSSCCIATVSDASFHKSPSSDPSNFLKLVLVWYVSHSQKCGSWDVIVRERSSLFPHLGCKKNHIIVLISYACFERSEEGRQPFNNIDWSVCLKALMKQGTGTALKSVDGQYNCLAAAKLRHQCYALFRRELLPPLYSLGNWAAGIWDIQEQRRYYFYHLPLCPHCSEMSFPFSLRTKEQALF